MHRYIHAKYKHTDWLHEALTGLTSVRTILV